MNVSRVTTAQAGALTGIKVADFTHVIAGPYTTQVLGDLGAAITKIEEPHHGDAGRHLAPFANGVSHYFTCFNRNKHSIALDLKRPEGIEVARRIIAEADVLVENFSPGAMERLGLGYDDVKAINPDIIYCSISGFGKTGPEKNRRYYDLIGQAYSGVMSTTGEPGGQPVKLGVPVGDTTGALFSVVAILAAINARRDTGRGQHIDISLQDCLLAVLANYSGYYFTTGKQPELVGSRHYFSVPYGAYRTSDGHVVLATSTDEQWQRFCKALELDALSTDPDLACREDRSDNREKIEAVVEAKFLSMTSRDVVARLDAAGIPASPLNDIGAALGSPQATARGMVREVTHPDYGMVRVVNSPLGAALTRPEIEAPPTLGQQTIGVLEELGYSDDQIGRLMASGVAGAPEI